MRDLFWQCLAIFLVVLAAFVFLHVLRVFAFTGEERGICAGVAACLVVDLILSPYHRRKRRSPPRKGSL